MMLTILCSERDSVEYWLAVKKAASAMLIVTHDVWGRDSSGAYGLCCVASVSEAERVAIARAAEGSL